MHITSLEIVNFLGVENLKLSNLGERVFFTGYNGGGKTTVIQAARRILFGRVFDARGKSIKKDYVVGASAKKAELKATIKHGSKLVKLHLTIGAKPTLFAWDEKGEALFADRAGAEDATRLALWEYLELDIEGAEAVSDMRSCLHNNDLGKLITKHYASKSTENELLEFCGENWDAVSSLLATHDLESLGSYFDKARLENTRALRGPEASLREHEKTEYPVKPDGKTPYAVEDGPKVEETLKGIRTKHAELLVELGRSQTLNADTIQSKRDNLADELEAKQKQLDEINAEIDEGSGAIAKSKAALKQAQESLVEAKGEYDLAVDNHRETEKLVTMQADGVCRVCGQEIEDAGVAVEKLPELATILADKKKQAKAAEEEHELALKEHNRLEGKNTGDIAIRDNYESQLAELKTKFDAVPEPEAIESPEFIQTKINLEAKKIERGEMILEVLKQLAEHKATEAEVERLKSERVFLEWGVKAFRDGEYFAQLISKHASTFVDEVNASLKSYGYSASLKVDKADVELVIGYDQAGSQMLPLSLLSNGERVVVEHAIASAWTDGAPVMVDDVDSLSSDNKREFTNALKSDSMGSSWVAGAWGMAKQQLEKFSAYMDPDVRVVWVEATNKEQ